MWKLLVTSDKFQDGNIYRLAKKFFEFKAVYIQDGNFALDFIKNESPDFIFLDLTNPVPGEDISSIFKNLNDSQRLKVTVFMLSTVKGILLKIFPLDFIDFVMSIFFRGKPAK